MVMSNDWSELESRLNRLLLFLQTNGPTLLEHTMQATDSQTSTSMEKLGIVQLAVDFCPVIGVQRLKLVTTKCTDHLVA